MTGERHDNMFDVIALVAIVVACVFVVVAAFVMADQPHVAAPDPGVTVNKGTLVDPKVVHAREVLTLFFPDRTPEQLDAVGRQVCELVRANGGTQDAARSFSSLFEGNDEGVAYRVTEISNAVVPAYCPEVAK